MSGLLRAFCAVASAALLVAFASPAQAAVDGEFLIADPSAKRFATAQVDDPQVVLLPRAVSFQVWRLTEDKEGLHTVASSSTGGCWTVPRFSVGQGSPIQQVPCTGAAEQQWDVQEFSTDGTVRFISAYSGRCAGTLLAEPTNKPLLRELDCTGGANQAFALLRP